MKQTLPLHSSYTEATYWVQDLKIKTWRVKVIVFKHALLTPTRFSTLLTCIQGVSPYDTFSEKKLLKFIEARITLNM
jgi:hypothetical protein